MKCCNPECEALFDYREGRLVRFAIPAAGGRRSGGQTTIQHFWLCGKCSEEFRFERDSNTQIRLRPREEKVRPRRESSDFVSAA